MVLKTPRTEAADGPKEVRERPIEFSKPLIGTRLIDLLNGFMFETIEVYNTKTRLYDMEKESPQ